METIDSRKRENVCLGQSSLNHWVLFLYLSFFFFDTNAQTLGSLNQKYEFVGINRSDFSRVSMYGTQRSLNWCWAACVQMVMNYQNVHITQEEIVKKSLGTLIDKPAGSDIMFRALNGWTPNTIGKSNRIYSNNFPTSTKEISSFLATQKPLIVGLRQGEKIGHAYVLIGMYYEVYSNSTGHKERRPHSVILADPWPGNPAINDMSWSEFKERLMVSYKVWIN